MAAVRRFLAHRGLVTILVLLLVLPAPLIWMGSSTSLLDPMLYSAVIEADVEFDAECNMVSRQITSASGRQDHVAKLEALASEGMVHLVAHATNMWTHLTNKGWTPAEIEALAQDFDLSSCGDHVGMVMTRSKLWRGWLNLMTFSSESWETTYEWVQG